MIRELNKEDFQQFWPDFKRIIAAQNSYAYEPDMSFEQAFELWCTSPLKTLVYEKQNAYEPQNHILGTYYIKANGMGPSSHICNCGYMVAESARGQGIAKQLCLHSQSLAKELGFSAMQFNAVVSTNTAAVTLWQKLGFDIIGTIPNAYQHKTLGFVDSYVMYKKLN
ncbi:GNAT family N-acetyltransferase [Reinekea thalattae]|uniref:GNAT family N-acetyltransferase n=1 Tax=Reinekea thalattae TaxID=2593301 RepID=A0A5C8Z1F8_9GAMM|nr:N-acetyltransferase [Reinekea thalattae]TXR51905.1 GNAT family N-acetyltransferase [Reinekea thalattae]